MVSNSFLTRGLHTLDCITARPRVTIDIDGHAPGSKKGYTTLDRIEGRVSLNVEHETPFHGIEITLEGYSRVSGERADPVLGQRVARHTFLRLHQPIEPDTYPTSGILESNTSYRFPFLFVIPERLLPQSCHHKASNGHQRHHTQLPPTFGDPNDMAPETCQISYAIRARVLKSSPGKAIADVSRKVRVIPAIDRGQPPKSGEETLHIIQRQKSIKTGLAKGSRGHLTITANQPQPVMLDRTGSGQHAIDTATTIHLRFDPKNNEQPPQLSTLRSKLGVRTFHGCGTPTRDKFNVNGEEVDEGHQNLSIEHVPLFSFCIASMEWTKHLSSNESAYPYPPMSSGNAYYTASITVPIYLPKDQQFVPSFHSCLISRIYTLDISLSYRTPKNSFLKHSLSVKIPISLDVAAPFRDSSWSEIDAEMEVPQFPKLECEKVISS